MIDVVVVVLAWAWAVFFFTQAVRRVDQDEKNTAIKDKRANVAPQDKRAAMTIVQGRFESLWPPECLDLETQSDDLDSLRLVGREIHPTTGILIYMIRLQRYKAVVRLDVVFGTYDILSISPMAPYALDVMARMTMACMRTWEPGLVEYVQWGIRIYMDPPSSTPWMSARRLIRDTEDPLIRYTF